VKKKNGYRRWRKYIIMKESVSWNLFGDKRRYLPYLIIIMVSLLTRGMMIFMEGIWWDDWAWVWHYLCTSDFNEFMYPIISLGTVL